MVFLISFRIAPLARRTLCPLSLPLGGIRTRRSLCIVAKNNTLTRSSDSIRQRLVKLRRQPGGHVVLGRVRRDDDWPASDTLALVDQVKQALGDSRR